MGFVWDLIQQSQLADRRAETETLEARVERFGEDVDGDGRVGGA